MQTRRSVVPSANYGPHPLGTKISLGLNTTGGGTVQVNGARVTGGKLTAGSVRTVRLSSDLVGPGTSGVVVDVTGTIG